PRGDYHPDGGICRRHSAQSAALVLQGRMDGSRDVTLQGKVALVTGASRGIGRAIALGLAAEGAQVAINYVSRPDAAAEVQAAIRGLGREGLPVQADVAVAADVTRMMAQITGHFGQIDVLVNNATLHRGRRVHKLLESDWDAVIDSCLKGAYH